MHVSSVPHLREADQDPQREHVPNPERHRQRNAQNDALVGKGVWVPVMTPSAHTHRGLTVMRCGLPHTCTHDKIPAPTADMTRLNKLDTKVPARWNVVSRVVAPPLPAPAAEALPSVPGLTPSHDASARPNAVLAALAAVLRTVPLSFPRGGPVPDPWSDATRGCPSIAAGGRCTAKDRARRRDAERTESRINKRKSNTTSPRK